MMTVRELMIELSQFDPERLVVIDNGVDQDMVETRLAFVEGVYRNETKDLGWFYTNREVVEFELDDPNNLQAVLLTVPYDQRAKK